MATCSYCKKSGWLVSVHEFNLCGQCSERHGGQLSHLTTNCLTALRAAERATKPAVALRNLARAGHCCLELVPFEKAGVVTISPQPTILLELLSDRAKRTIEQAIFNIETTARSRSVAAASDAGKLGAYSSAIGELQKLNLEFSDISSFANAAAALQHEMDATRVKVLLQKSAVAEVKGNTKKAVEWAVEALAALAHDATPDAQQSDLKRLAEDRLRHLNGAAPTSPRMRMQ